MAAIFGPHLDAKNTGFHADPSLHDQRPENQSFLASQWKGFPAALRMAWAVMVLRKPSAQASLDQFSMLPLTNWYSRFLNQKSVNTLWGSMLHPPLSYLGDEHQYRTADGSNNNFLFPELGKAGLPYAKSVPPQGAVHGARPDPGDIFDLLMAREDHTESNLGLSSMLLYHATIIIHDIFRTNANDKNISDTSSYLDLSPLYGHNLETQRAVRAFEDGRLKVDCFADERLARQPPGVGIYLIMFNRYHNYSAEQLLAINENDKFSLKPHEAYNNGKTVEENMATSLKKRDEDLFQTARLITCGLYVNISIHDYLRVLMRLHTKDTSWTLDPRIEIPEKENKEGIKRGIGNQVTVEFNLLYRFHSPLSKRDSNWIDDQAEAMKKMMHGPRGNSGNAKPQPAYISYARNNATGKYDDDKLVEHLVESIEDPICRFGAMNTPKALRQIEIDGIHQARKWEIATLNDFREFFGLPRHETFEDINTDPKIQRALRKLYEDPDMIELYPGLFCEGDGRCLDPGTSCPNDKGTALWRCIFSDAVTLVRSDRFYTTDWNVGSLTAWGMREVSSDPSILKGSVFHRLIQRAFPGYFKFNSIHLWEPFHTPAMNVLLASEQNHLAELENLASRGLRKNVGYYKKHSEELKEIVKMTVSKRPDPIQVSDYSIIQNEILGKNKSRYVNIGLLDEDSIEKGALREILAGRGVLRDETAGVLAKLVTGKEQALFLAYFVEMSREIREREERAFQWTDAGQVYQIDIIKDYAIPVVTRFVADLLGFGDLVKTKKYPNREYDENEIYQHINNVQKFLSYNSDETTTWKRRIAFRDSIKFLKEKAERGMARAQRGFFEFLTGRSYGTADETKEVKKLREFATELSRCLKRKRTNEEAAAMLLVATLEAAHKTILAFNKVIAFFIGRPTDWESVKRLARKDTPATDDVIKHYVLEAQRLELDIPLTRVYTGSRSTEVTLTAEQLKIMKPWKKGDVLLLDVQKAQQNEKAFPNPGEIDLTRDLGKYLVYGHKKGDNFDMKHLTIIALTGMIKHAAKLKRLRWAHDQMGELKTARTPHDPAGYESYLTIQWDELVPFPTTWNLRFDGIGDGVYQPKQGTGTGNVLHVD